MATIGNALVAKLTLDQAQFQSGLKRSQKASGEFGAALRQNFKRSAIALAAIGAAAAVVGVKLLNLGAKASATTSRFNTVFGASAENVAAFGAEFTRIAGISRTAFKETIATTAAIAQGMGFAQQASADFSIEVTKLAADLASFNNLETADVAQRINSALTGERESMKQLGVVITEVDVQQVALFQSGKKVASALTQQEKATATLAIISQRAGVAVGDLSRTANETDNVIKQLTAAWKSLTERIGEFVAGSPVVQAALIGVRDFLSQITTILDGSAAVIREAFAQLGAIAGASFGFGASNAIAEFLERLGFEDIFVRQFRKLADFETEIVAQSLTIISGLAAEVEAGFIAVSRAASTVAEPLNVVVNRTFEWREIVRPLPPIIDRISVSAAKIPPIINDSKIATEGLIESGRRWGKAIERSAAETEKLRAATTRLSDSWDEVRAAAERTAKTITDRVSRAVTDLVTRFKSVLDVIRDVGRAIVELIVKKLVDAVAKAIGLADALARAGRNANFSQGGFGGGFGGGFARQPDQGGGIRIFESGGVVPGRGPVPIIAHGGEVVLSRESVSMIGGAISANSLNIEPAAPTMSSGGDTFILNITANDPRELARQLPALIKDARRKGRIR